MEFVVEIAALNSSSSSNIMLPTAAAAASSTTNHYSFHDSMAFWMNGVLSLLLVIVGMLGNAAVLVSFHFCGGRAKLKQRRRQAYYYYGLTFCIWNSGLLLATVLFNCIPALTLTSHQASSPPDPELMHLTDLTSLIGYLWGNCCVTANVWLAVTLTVERYLAVSRPLRSRLSSPRRRAKIVCSLLSLLVLVYNCPLLFEMEFVPVVDYDSDDSVSLELAIHNSSSDDGGALLGRVLRSLDDGSPEMMFDNMIDSPPVAIGSRSPPPVVLKLRLSAMRDNFYYQFLYRVVANFVFVSFVPFTIIFLLTIKIVCVVRESDRKRARFRKPTPSSGGCGGESGSRSLSNPTAAAGASSSITVAPGVSAPPPSPTPPKSPAARYADIVLTLIASKFLFFYSLPVVVNIFELTSSTHTFESDDSDASRSLRFLVDLANLLVVIDGATNSFFYFSWRNHRSRTSQGVSPPPNLHHQQYHHYSPAYLQQQQQGAYHMTATPRSTLGYMESRRASRLDQWSPSVPTTNELTPFRGLALDRTWIPLRNAAGTD